MDSTILLGIVEFEVASSDSLSFDSAFGKLSSGNLKIGGWLVVVIGFEVRRFGSGLDGACKDWLVG